MSSVVISGDTSGAITLSAPAVAGTNTITLPAVTGTAVVTGTTPTLNGITFPATQVPSADANTLDDYEEGTWTPTDGSGASLSLTVGNARYTKVGNIVTLSAEILYPATASTAPATIAGFPFTSAGSSTWGGFPRYTNKSLTYTLAVVPSGTSIQFYNNGGSAITNLQLTAGRADFVAIYTV